MSKKICHNKDCKKVSIHTHVEDGCQKGACLAHIPMNERDIFKAKRYEHAILNTIISNLDDDNVREIIHDQTVKSPVWAKDIKKISKATAVPVEDNSLKIRPDLLIVSNSKTNDIVIVEVDEHFHCNNKEKDEKREELLIQRVSQSYRVPKERVHIVRIIPNENKINGILRKNTKKLLIKNSNYDDMINVAISKVSKRLIGVSSPMIGDELSRKIDSISYHALKSPEKRTLQSLYKKQVNPNKILSSVKNSFMAKKEDYTIDFAYDIPIDVNDKDISSDESDDLENRLLQLKISGKNEDIVKTLTGLKNDVKLRKFSKAMKK